MQPIQIEYYFDLGSPYSFLGFHQIQRIAQKYQAEIVWKPMLLGGVFKATGNSSPISIPAKGRYTRSKLKRWSALLEIPMQVHPDFPINTLTMMRILTAIQLYQPAHFIQVANVLFDALYREHQAVNDPQVLLNILATVGLTAEQVQDYLADEQVKAQLKLITEQAVARGVFGAPTFFIAEELFWGMDDLHFMQMTLDKIA